MKWSTPIVVAAVLVVLDIQIFTSFFENEAIKGRIRSPRMVVLIFTSVVFIHLCSLEMTFSRPLPAFLEMMFEFLVSMFIFELLRTWIWGPFEIVIYSSLPNFLDKMFWDRPHFVTEISLGNTQLFTVLGYFVVILLLLISLYMTEITDFPFMKKSDDNELSALCGDNTLQLESEKCFTLSDYLKNKNLQL